MATTTTGITTTSPQQLLDVNWPFVADGRGYFAPCRDEAEDVRQEIRHCIYVGPRQQLFRMEGCDLRSLVWEEEDVVFESLARLMIGQALRPVRRIVLEDVVTARTDDGHGAVKVAIGIFYHRKGSRFVESTHFSATYTR